MAYSSTPSAAASPLKLEAPPRATGLTGALDLLTHQAQSEMGNVLQSIFFLTDGLQRATTDGVFSLFQPATWAPSNILRLSADAAREAMLIARLLDPEQARLAWAEMRNKLEVFVLVKNLSSILHLPPGEFIPLPQLVEKAYTVDPFSALWAVEGLGHYYTDMYWEKKGVPQGLLLEENAPVPAKGLLMLHAGMGLAFADRLLGELTSEATPAQILATVHEFLSLCENNSRPGYLGAAIESLGLVTRDFYPDLLTRMNEQLSLARPEYAGFFWHGVGRALYFSREYFLPAVTPLWTGLLTEARNAPEQLSALAGLSWAVTLVNMRQPAIMENLVRSSMEHVAMANAFSNGVASSIIMRSDTTPGEPMVPAFYQYQPRHPEMAGIWQRYITAPVSAALQTQYPVLRENHALDQVFRYQDLPALAALLQGGNRRQ